MGVVDLRLLGNVHMDIVLAIFTVPKWQNGVIPIASYVQTIGRRLHDQAFPAFHNTDRVNNAFINRDALINEELGKSSSLKHQLERWFRSCASEKLWAKNDVPRSDPDQKIQIWR